MLLVAALGTSVYNGALLSPRVAQEQEAIKLEVGGLHQLDADDPGGVFNREAAEWWQVNADRIPLTREPFLGHRPTDPEQR